MYCGLILAGGDSSRMGDDKAKMNFGGRSLAAIAAENLHVAGCEDILVSTRDGIPWQDWNHCFVADAEGWVGPQAGLFPTLSMADEMGCKWVQLSPCDLPLLKPTLFTFLYGQVSSSDTALMPYGPNGAEPLLALVRPKEMCAALLANKDLGKKSIFAVLERIGAKPIPYTAIAANGIGENEFLNANTLSDLRVAESLLER